MLGQVRLEAWCFEASSESIPLFQNMRSIAFDGLSKFGQTQANGVWAVRGLSKMI